MAEYSFFVPGHPAPGGSKKFVGFSKATGRAILVDAAGQRNKDWRTTVQVFAQQAGVQPLDGPIALTVRFCMPRPKSHYGTGRKASHLKAAAPSFHTTKPDTTKLLRSTEDALAGIAWKDDAQVCVQTATKRYDTKPGAWITIQQLPLGGGLEI